MSHGTTGWTEETEEYFSPQQVWARSLSSAIRMNHERQPSYLNNLFLEAVQRGHVERVEECLIKGGRAFTPWLPRPVDHGLSKFAIKYDSPKMAAMLERHEAMGIFNVTCHPDDLQNIFFHAVETNKTEAVKECIDLGVDIDSIAPGRGTALHIAARAEATPMVNLLLSKGADALVAYQVRPTVSATC